ncbi:MAG: triose-phosphate isomerase [Candidatus Yanofskybacteria bacterium]|nr:triose-phosphate isomerase [Candidatus Yanofskybacteria bacterium]
MSKKYIVANWKMQPTTLAEAEQILDTVNEYLGSLNEKEFSLVFCPPFVFLEEVGKILKTSHLEHEASLGAQDIFWEDKGADTGEISGPMLNKLDVEYVIVGHSERRWKLGESDEVVNKKLKAVLRNAMVPIVCVGERVRDENFKEFLKEQVNKTFAGLSNDELVRCIIAYEPVWAISSNPGALPDTPESALESIAIIQKVLDSRFKIQDSRFLYGGSVTSKNAADFIGQKEIDGVLVGGASVNKEEFVKILRQI